MKKLFLSILVICSLLGGNAYAKRYIAEYKNYFDTDITGYELDNKSLKISKKKALDKCKKKSKSMNVREDGCLLFKYEIYGILDTLKGTEYVTHPSRS